MLSHFTGWRLGNPLAGRATPDLLPRPAVGRAYLASQPEGQDNPDGFPESPRGGLGRGDREPGLQADREQQEGPRLGSQVGQRELWPGLGGDSPLQLTPGSVPACLLQTAVQSESPPWSAAVSGDRDNERDNRSPASPFPFFCAQASGHFLYTYRLQRAPTHTYTARETRIRTHKTCGQIPRAMRRT